MMIDKIVCVGQNYLKHIIEMGSQVPEKPVLFLKPASILKQAKHWNDTLSLEFPHNRGELHFECEVVLRIAQDGYQLTASEATHAIDALTLGLDMTLRDLQSEQKKQGKPWTTSKVFKDAAVIGPWIPVTDFADYLNTEFTFTLNGAVRQRATAAEMMLKPQDLIVYISQFFPLCKGDIIFTGTPAGVGPVTVGAKGKLSWRNWQYFVEW